MSGVQPSSSNLEKHQSGNPILQHLLRTFHRLLSDWVNELEVISVLDAGCGEGFVAKGLMAARPGLDYVGIDPDPQAIELARGMCPQARFDHASIEDLPLNGSKQFDLVLCIEVLEHLPDPQEALRRLAKSSRKYVLLTVPWEPWFTLGNLLRGKYLQTWGNHPEHINRWSHRRFVEFAAGQVDVVRSAISYPWTLLLGQVAGS